MQKYSQFTEPLGYRFTFEGNSVDYDSDISSYTELINIIWKLFSIGSESAIALYYLDCDNEEVRITSHEDFARVVNYHSNTSQNQKIPLKLYRDEFKPPKIYEVPQKKLSSSVVEENVIDNIAMSDSHIISANIPETSIAKLILELKQEMKESTTKIEETIARIQKEIEDNLQQKLLKLVLANNNYQKIPPRNFNSLKIIREISLEIFDNASIEELPDPQLAKTVQALKSKKGLVCSFCSNKPAVAICYFCENTQICDECNHNHKHDFHPQIFPKNTSQLVSYRTFGEKSSMIRFFAKKLSSLTVEIIPQIPQVFEIKANSPIFFPIEILNKSDEIIKMGELLITAKNSKSFWERNEINPHDILQNFTCAMNCQLVAPECNGVFEVEIICLHCEKNIQAPPLKLTITVMNGEDSNMKKSSLKTIMKKFF